MVLATMVCFASALTVCTYAARRYRLQIDLVRMHVLLIGGASVLAAFMQHDRSVAYAVVVAVCAVSAVSDLQTGFIFDAVVAPAIAILLSLSVVNGTLESYAAGAAVAAGVPLALFVLTRGSGIGFGDVKIGCCIGALGAAAALHVLEAAFIAGGGVALVLIALRGRDARRMEMPFAPFLFGGVLYSALVPGIAL